MASAIKDDDPRPLPVNDYDVPTFVRFNFWLSGFLTIIVGLVFVGTESTNNPVCPDASQPGCIGGSLTWGRNFNIDRDLNFNWRLVFSLRPSLLVENWTPVFVGIISFTSHFPGFSYAFVTRTWLHCAAWNVFLALFGHLGYSGNLGIIFGTYTVIVGIMCTGMQFTRWRNERPILHISPAHFLNRFSFMVENEVVFTFARALGFGLGIASMVSGLIFVLTNNFVWCPHGIWTECYGPSLRWNSNGQSFVQDANGNLSPPAWRSVFTFDPEVFFPLWGPVILGYLTIIQHFDGRTWAMYATWPRVFLWFLFLGLFGNMGYTGSLGILIGFLCVFESALALMISIGGGTNVRTHFQMKIHFLND